MSWGTREVFVSSTFADMQSERDCLQSIVFPALEEKLQQSRMRIEWVDLRVGVATSSVEAEEREVHVLKVCLSEVERCRPYLLVLLGDRYGWVPPAERLRSAAQEAGLSGDFDGCSVTDLEIRLGLLEQSDIPANFVVYIRDPLPYEAMTPVTAGKFCERHAKDAGANDRWQKLEALKSRLVARYRDRVHRYRAEWNGSEQRVVGLEAWGQAVIDEMFKALAPAETEERRTTWEEDERAAFADFIEERTRSFVGRHDVLDEVVNRIDGPAGRGVLLVGVSGSGKSALFGKIVQRLTARGDIVLGHAATASVRSHRMDDMLRRWISELATITGSTIGLAVDATPAQVEAAFGQALSEACRIANVVIAIDALDQFDAKTRVTTLSWLPRPWPHTLRVIATSVEAKPADVLLTAPELITIEIPPLLREEATALIEAICRRYHRTLEPQVMSALTAQGDSSVPAWSSPLWTVIAAEAINLVDADDFDRASKDYVGEPAERLRDLLVDFARSLPLSIPDLYATQFIRAGKLVDQDAVIAFFSALTAGRHGWSDLDLLSVLPELEKLRIKRPGLFKRLLGLAPKVDKPAWDELKLAVLRRSFRGQLVRRAETKQLDFGHAQMRVAARAWIDQHDVDLEAVHFALADHLQGLPSSNLLRRTEVMWHLLHSKRWAAAGRYFGSRSLDDEELRGAALATSDFLLATKADNAWLAHSSILMECKEADVKGRVAYRLSSYVYRHVAARIDVEHRSNLLTSWLQALGGGINKDNAHDLSLLAIGDLHVQLGDVRELQGRNEEALTSWSTAEAMFKRVANSPELLVELGDEYIRHSLPIDSVIPRQRRINILQSAGRYPEALIEATAVEQAHRGSVENRATFNGIRNLATALERLALIELWSGKPCWDHIAECVELRKRICEIAPDLIECIRDLGSSYAVASQVLRDDGYGEQAIELLQESRKHLEQALARDPSNISFGLDLASTLLSLGSMYGNRGEMDAEIAAYRSADSVLAKLVTLDPTNTRNRATWAGCVGRLAETHFAAADRSSSASEFRRAIEIFEQIEGLSSNKGWSEELSKFKERLRYVQDGGLEATLIHPSAAPTYEEKADLMFKTASSTFLAGTLLQKSGDNVKALEAYTSMAVTLKDLVASVPDKPEYRRELVTALVRIGDMHLELGDLRAARLSYSNAGGSARRLCHAYPAVLDYMRDLGFVDTRLGDVATKVGDNQGALEFYRRGLKMLSSALDSAPDNVEYRTHVAVCLGKMGQHYLMMENPVEALRCFVKGYDVTAVEEPNRSSPALVQHHGTFERYISQLTAGSHGYA